MKNKWRAVACILCMTVIGTSAASCSKKSDTDQKKTAVDQTTKKEEVKEYQSKLDVIRPQAYSNVEGLNLEKGTYLSIIGKGEGTSYWKEVKAGVQQAADDINAMLGYKGEDKIKVNYSGPSQMDSVDEQINILDEELARYPEALGIAPIDSTACTVQFDLAGENDIPIVTFDSGSDYQDISSKCATDNTSAAQTAAVKLSDMLEDKGEIVVIAHDSKSTTGKVRETAFTEEIKNNHPEVKVVQVYHMDELDMMAKQIAQEKSTPEQAVEPESITQEDVIEYILEKNPDIKGIYATNVDASQLVVNVCENLEKEDLPVVAFDGGEEQLKALEDGNVEGLIIQNPYGMGYATVIAAARSVLGMGNEANVDTGYTWVTKENMDNKAIKQMLY